MTEQVIRRPEIVRTTEIAPLAQRANFETRPFAAHPRLAASLAGTGARVSRVQIPALGSARLEPMVGPSLLVLLSGSVTAPEHGALEPGDLLTVPPAAGYELTNLGTERAALLQVAFSSVSALELGDVELTKLLAHNEQRCQQLVRGPFYSLFTNGALSDPKRLNRTLECVRVFADAFQTFLFTRQAMCQEQRYAEEFNEHLREEIGHNLLLGVTPYVRAVEDPVLRAAASWFSYQMIVLDDLGKIIVNLVLETAGYHLGMMAGPVFSGHSGENYFGLHGEADEHHRDLGVHHLRGQSREAYARIRDVLEQSWDALDTMTGRLAHLIQFEEQAS